MSLEVRYGTQRVQPQATAQVVSTGRRLPWWALASMLLVSGLVGAGAVWLLVSFVSTRSAIAFLFALVTAAAIIGPGRRG